LLQNDSRAVEKGVEFVAWLGLFDEKPLPVDTKLDSPLDVTAQLLQRSEMAYKPGERDMVAMLHELDVERHDGQVERHVATLIEYGESRGASAMARTVGLTAAICAQLVLDAPTGHFGAGVQRPLRPEWYEPVLAQLGEEGIHLDERVELLQERSAAMAEEERDLVRRTSGALFPAPARARL
jgi:hypothetical protein